MKLIVDSGSSKSLWYFLGKGVPVELRTRGYNPYYFPTIQALIKSLEEELQGQIDWSFRSVEEVVFYSAGCHELEGKNKIKEALMHFFPLASIEVHSDILAVARACCGREPGFCAILGTGSNSCFYNGQVIEDQVPALGYILGDEGSATHLAKKFLQAYFYREMPNHLKKALDAKNVIKKHRILNEMSKSSSPNTYLATFSLYCEEFKNEAFIQQLINNCFNEFIERHLLKYAKIQRYPIHFIGSVAFAHQHILKELLSQRGLQAGIFLQHPFPKLLSF